MAPFLERRLRDPNAATKAKLFVGFSPASPGSHGGVVEVLETELHRVEARCGCVVHSSDAGVAIEEVQCAIDKREPIRVLRDAFVAAAVEA